MCKLKFWKASRMVPSLALAKLCGYEGFVLRLHVTKTACRKCEVSVLLTMIANSDCETSFINIRSNVKSIFTVNCNKFPKCYSFCQING